MAIKLTPIMMIGLLISSPTLYSQEEPVSPDSTGNTAPESTTDDATSTTEPSSPPDQTPSPKLERPQPNPTKARMESVLRFLQLNQRSHELMQFDASGLSVSGLYMEENTGKPQGGVLILHDVEQHAHWPETVSPLREYLPDYGWNTLSLFMEKSPSVPLPAVPDRNAGKNTPDNEAVPATEEASAPTNETNEPPIDQAPVTDAEQTTEAPADLNALAAPDAGDPLGDIAATLDRIPTLATEPPTDTAANASEPTIDQRFLESVSQQVKSSLAHLNNLGQFNLVIIAHGVSANWAVAALNDNIKDQPKAKGFALVLVDAFPSRYPDYPLNTLLANLDIPILDIYTGILENEVRAAADRKNAMQRNQRNLYMQMKLPAVKTALTGKHNLLSRRIRGWLKTHAAGEEVDVKTKK